MSTDINNPYPFEGFEPTSQRENIKQQKPRKPHLGIVTRLAATEENDLEARTIGVVGNKPKKVGWAAPLMLAAGLTTAAIAVNNDRESHDAPDQLPIPGHVIEVQQPVDLGQPVLVEQTSTNPQP